MAIAESRKRANAKWDKENMTTLGCKIKREQAAAFKAYCENRGSTSNTVLKDFVLGCIGELGPGTTPGLMQVAGTVSLPAGTLEVAQRAAGATGETADQFISRAVETQAKRDKVARKMEGAHGN